MTKYSVSEFYCTRCGKKGLPVQRKRGQNREPGHLKRLYCIYCRNEINAVEVAEKGKYTPSMFQTEFNNGNFTEEGQRKEPYKQFLRRFLHG